MRVISILCAASLVVAGLIHAGDSFEAIKTRLSDAGCVHFDFLSIINSEVFDEVDTTRGSADIARDGRFNVRVGTDQYVYDLAHLYSYSQDANQVVIEKPDQSVYNGSQLAFVTRLDKFFETKTIKPGKRYRLVKKNEDDVDLPDTMIVNISGDSIENLQYYDINGDLNTIALLKQTTSDSCRTDLFVPSFPDSVERVKL